MSEEESDDDAKFTERALHKLKARHQFINATTGLLGATVEIKLELLIMALKRKQMYAQQSREMLMVIARQLTNLDMVRLVVEQDICQIRLRTTNIASPSTPTAAPGSPVTTTTSPMGPGQEILSSVVTPGTPKARKMREDSVKTGANSTALVRNLQLTFTANADRAESLGFARGYVSDHIFNLQAPYGEGSLKGVFYKEVPFSFLTNLVPITRLLRIPLCGNSRITVRPNPLMDHRATQPLDGPPANGQWKVLQPLVAEIVKGLQHCSLACNNGTCLLLFECRSLGKRGSEVTRFEKCIFSLLGSCRRDRGREKNRRRRAAQFSLPKGEVGAPPNREKLHY